MWHERTIVLGGRPVSGHFTNYHLFQIVLSYASITIGVSARQHRSLVADDVRNHIREIEEASRDETDTIEEIQEVMIDNITTHYLIKTIYRALIKRPIPSIADTLVCAAGDRPSIFSFNHMLIKGHAIMCFCCKILE